MALEAGGRLLHYRLVEQIGEGGMGVVWKAVDTTLDRDVAIKVLPDAFAADTERLGRFEREAKALASLNHPNIASIYGLHATEDGLRFLSMELIGGEDLSDRLARGPLATAEALGVALQIAAALEAAHDNGIIHRDLKPANVRFSGVGGASTSGSTGAGGSVKVLDFGLAKALEGEVQNQDMAQSPTLTGMATQAGVILGTASYMSPEQARGQAADRRADIWSFGVVVYEMLTGQRPFGGSTVSDTLADILRAEVDLAALPADTPGQVRRLLARALAKDAAQRLQAIGDARLELRDALDAPELPRAPGGTATTAPRKGRALVVGLVAVAIVATLAAVAGWLRPSAAPRDTTRLSITLPPGEELQAAPSISRDGRQIAYVSRKGVEPTQLYVRALDAFEPRAIPGTADADQPFFSPDGRAVGFYADGNLQVVELSGGSPRVLAAAPAPFGATWADDGHIIFTTTINAGLMRIPAAGGPVESLTQPDGAGKGYAHTWPRVLPGGKQVLFSIWAGEGYEGGTALLDRTAGTWRLLSDVSGGHFVDSGHVLTPWDLETDGDIAALGAAPLNDGAGALAAAAVVLEGVLGVPWRDESWLSVATDGTLAYVPGTVADRRLVWVDPSGNVQTASDTRAVHDNLALSHDGKRAVVKNTKSLWVYDLEGGTRIRLTAESNNGGPVWDRDGRRVFFSSNRGGDWDLYVRSADGTGETEHLWDREFSQWATSISPDGVLAIVEPNPQTGEDLWIREPDGETRPFLATSSNESSAQFSPDGSLVAYESDETGRPEIYVLPYPGPGPRVPISREGGTKPLWSRDGNVLHYFQGDAVMAATLARDRELTVVKRDELFSGKFMTRYDWSWGLAPDGRFLMIHRDSGSVPDRINVVLNWTDELKRLVPPR